ncbi:transmembrane emp24 domain-containing protein [Holotrichia oblita]|uniref:Transmembrane emp24 domain-containing protein n=1 Tax=Holotrichia oblita TaxID=644536 RepID=A0ACB9SSA4_HOLOL|nr:transmembrane emp24 domain-containing protein [Holotrichia oblita]
MDNYITVLLALCFCTFANGLYFHIAETERKCFIEEIPGETSVIVNYKVELYDPRSGGFMPSSPGIGMHVEVRDPDDQIILSRVYSSEGRISFTSHTPGEHVICMYSNSTAWFSGSQLRVHLDIQVGEHAINYGDVVQKEKLSELQLRIRQLLDQVDQITKEQNYQRFREERFRQTSESTNSRVLWWSITQTAVLLIMGAWQMKHLKSFFEAKKLV